MAIFVSLPCAFGSEESGSSSLGNPDGLVEVEPRLVEYSKTTGGYELKDFVERRGTWGSQISIGFSMYTPFNYESEFSAFDFDEAYGYSSELPLIEFQYTLKRNFLWGSVGLEIGAGIYENTSDIDAIDSKLQLIPIRLGGTFILDGLTKIPYVAPYFSAGAYTIMFEETQDGTNTFGGNTQVAPYFTFGAQFSLDWVDPRAARQGFEDHGIQATFLYVEGRKFIASSAARDRDFENDIEANMGLRVEF